MHFAYFRHLLLSAGPQFSEELWHNVCKGIKQIFDATLSNLKELIVCFQSGSTSVSGDNGMHVKVVARKDSTLQETARFLQIAEQVGINCFMSSGLIRNFLCRAS